MFMLKRNRELKALLKEYLNTGIQTVDCFRDGLLHYSVHGLEGLDDFALTTHREESTCDHLRRTIEAELFGKALMPESREDVMELLEHIDLIMNQAEDVLRQIVNQCIVLPTEYMSAYGELVGVCHETCTLLMQQTLSTFVGDTAAQVLGDRIEELESASDVLEQDMIRRLFRSDLSLAEKMHYRDLVSATSMMCDLAEDAANLITICRIKREI